MNRRAGIVRLLTVTIGCATAVAGLGALPSAARAAAPSPVTSRRPGVQSPVVLGPTPASPTTVGEIADVPDDSLHASVTAPKWTVHYDAGFNANAAAKTAFQAAVDQWSKLIYSPVPIEIDASFTPLPVGVLGSAGPNSLFANFTGAPQANTYYPSALANSRHGSDLDPLDTDITAQFSSSYSGFYFGTDGNTGGKVDFESVVLHELGHGLGFLGGAGKDPSNGTWSCCPYTYPFVYDTMSTGNGTPITSISPANLPAAMQGADVRFTGVAATAANGGVAPKLYAPNPWQSGSSYSHLDEATYPAGDANSLMTPAIGANEVIHSPGPVTLGLFTDTGWVIGGLPTLSIGSAKVVEGNLGTRTLRANVTLSKTVPWAVTAKWSTSNVTAVAGSDYSPSTGTLTIPAGATTATPASSVLSDRVAEVTEKFAVRLSAPSGAVLGSASTWVYILDDDPSWGLSISAGTSSVGEGDLGDRVVGLTVSMSTTSTRTITVDWSTGSGTATAGVDYDAASGTLTFAPGALTARIPVRIHPDTTDEVTETIPILLSNANAPIARPVGTIAINDDD